jgi:hypothetical protein
MTLQRQFQNWQKCRLRLFPKGLSAEPGRGLTPNQASP